MRRTMAMSSSPMAQAIAIALLAIAAALGLAAASSSVINETCTVLKPGSRLPYDYCVGVLSADPAAAAATDVPGLAAATVNITAVKAAATLRVINYLLDELNICRDSYKNMVLSLADALADLGAGRFRNASLEIALNASGRPMDCDIQLFEGYAHKNPLDNENSENDNLVGLANDIIDLVIKNSTQVVNP